MLVFSARPGRIIEDVSVPFGPGLERTADLKLSTEFMQRKRQLITLLHPGVRPPIERQALLASLVRPSNQNDRNST